MLTRAGGPIQPALRAIIDGAVERVSDSCGFAVPITDHRADRDLLSRRNGRRSAEDATDYRRRRNYHSIDGLPALAEQRCHGTPCLTWT